MQAISDALASFWQIWSPNLTLDVGRYVVAAGGMALILKLFWNAGLGRRKIQVRAASRADVRREILTSLRTGIIFSLTGVVIVLGAMHGVFTVYTDFETAGIGYLAISLIAIIVAHDAYFYWTHRLMHHPRLFRYFHRTHHRSVTPTPACPMTLRTIMKAMNRNSPSACIGTNNSHSGVNAAISSASGTSKA